MAAYAALVSVLQTLDQIQLHPRLPISLHQKQVASLTQIISFLQNFLEDYNPHLTYTAEADPLESRIADAAYAAEDVIESHIILRQNISSIEFYQDLQKVIEEMDMIKIEAVEIKEMTGLQIKNPANDAGTFSSTSSTAPKVSMVGFEDVLLQMLEKITRGQLDHQIIPIVGMGGIGKTTLARNIYLHPLVKQHFDVCAWSTVSQVHNEREILRQVLDQIDKKDRGNSSQDELGEQLYKYLIGRRYLVVMDDMWSIEAWDGVRRFFPDNQNGSRIVITTRLSNLASNFNCSNRLDMKFLDEGSSWNIFSKIVFGEELCPIELEDIGKKIVEGCKGLPLSIAVIGGLLSKSARTREIWELIEGNLNSIVNLENNESCLQILYMSYNNLPVYLKPCFLYMGVFPEDGEIIVRFLITLWAAEGFLKPNHVKSMEEIGEEYLEELVDRNLILVEKRSHFGKIKSCKIHDLLRDLSLREAQKMKFLCVLGEQSIHNIQDMCSQRRIRSTLSTYPTPLLQSLESASFVRSLNGKFPKTLLYNYGLLRVSLLDTSYCKEERRYYYVEVLPQLVNLRFLFIVCPYYALSYRILSSITHLWNLQTLIILNAGYDYILEIWKMRQLRHVMAYKGSLSIPDPPLHGDMDIVVLENLQSLFAVRNLSLDEGVLKRIPNIKILKLYYGETSRAGDDFCLNNLHCLHKLESLRLRSSFNFHSIPSFPYSLKKLTLVNMELHSEDMKTKIGSMPLLQVLKLRDSFFIGYEWETFEDQFSSLKFLMIHSCGLEYWKTGETHFPRLEHLVLQNLSLKEIPLSIGDIPTLESIKTKYCSDSVVDSARRILEVQEELGNEGLQLHI